MLAVCPQAAHPPADHRAVRRLSSPSESDPTTVRPDYPTLSLSLVAAQQPRAARRTATRQPPRTWLRAQPPHRWPTRVLRLSCLCPFPIPPYAFLTLSSRYRASLRARRSSTTLAVVWRPQPQPAGKQRSGSMRAVRRPRSVRVPLATWRCFFMRWICSAGAIKEPKGQRQDENGLCFLTFRGPCRGWHRSAWLPRGPQPEAVRSRWGTPASSRQEGVNSAAWVSRECREEYWPECSNVQTQPGADGARKTRQGVSSRSVTLAVSGSRKLHHSK